MNENTGYTIQRDGRALLLLHDLGQSPLTLRPLAESLAQGGLTTRVPALFQRGAHWSEWLRTARSAYTGLLNAYVRVSLCALGESEALALLLAEAYAPEELLLAPAPRRRLDAPTRFALRALERRARRGLFALEGQPRILLPEDADPNRLRRARRLSRLLGSCAIEAYRSGALPEALAARLDSGQGQML